MADLRTGSSGSYDRSARVPPVHRWIAPSFDKPWTDRKVLLFGAGDSITAGLGARTVAHGYFNRLVECPPDESPDMAGICLSAVLPNLSILNIAVSGSNSLDHVNAVRQELPLQSADTLGLVVLTTGGQ